MLLMTRHSHPQQLFTRHQTVTKNVKTIGIKTRNNNRVASKGGNSSSYVSTTHIARNFTSQQSNFAGVLGSNQPNVCFSDFVVALSN